MKWSDVRKLYDNQWVVIETLKAKSEGGKRMVEEMAIIGAFENGSEALKS